MEASSSSAKTTMKPNSNTNNATSDEPSDGANGPPSGFVLKLYQMVTDAPDDIVSWEASGGAFRISDLHRLEHETLPCFFRHGRFQSLVRQLNFYNFRKVNRERTFWIYRHPLFHRDRPFDLHLLRRRTCPGVDGRKGNSSGGNPSAAIVHSERGRDALEDDVGDDDDIYCEEEKSFSMVDGSADTETEFSSSQKDDTYGMRKENHGKPVLLEDNEMLGSKPSALLLQQAKFKRRKAYQSKRHEYKNQFPEATSVSEKTPSEYSAGENTIKKRRKSWHLSFPKRSSSDEIRSEISFDGANTEYPMEEVAQDNATLHDDMQLDLSQPEEADEDACIDQTSSNNLINLDERQNWRDSAEQSQVVLQIAQQLQARMKRAEEERNYRSGKHRGGRGRPSRAERNFYGDTMRYHALTYDDEIMDEEDDVNVRPASKKKSSATKVAPVVTDDSDSSEDDIASFYTTPSKKNLVANLRYLSTTHSDLFTPSPFPIRDPNVAAQIYQKLLFELGNIPATVIHFCLMTPPSLEAEGNLKQMLHANPQLAEDFEHYRSALVPHASPDGNGNETSRTSCNTPHFHTPVYSHTYGGDSGKGILRDFGAFALNSMDLLFSNPALMDTSDKTQNPYTPSLTALDQEQSSVVQLCAKVWYDSSHIFS